MRWDETLSSELPTRVRQSRDNHLTHETTNHKQNPRIRKRIHSRLRCHDCNVCVMSFSHEFDQFDNKTKRKDFYDSIYSLMFLTRCSTWFQRGLFIRMTSVISWPADQHLEEELWDSSIISRISSKYFASLLSLSGTQEGRVWVTLVVSFQRSSRHPKLLLRFFSVI